jgi:hypothetical protein
MSLSRDGTDPDALSRLPSEIGRHLAGRNLSDITFRGLYFDGSLAGANLTGCFFEKCDLSQVSLHGAVLERTVFQHCRLPDTELADAKVDSVTIDGEDFFGPELAAKTAQNEAEREVAAASAAEAAAAEVRAWVTGVLRGRLAKFLIARGGEAFAGLDMSISWTRFMGGTNPRERDFIVRRLYRALRAENIVFDAPTGMARIPTVFLSTDSEIRTDVLAFVRDHKVGPSIERVIGRLIK